MNTAPAVPSTHKPDYTRRVYYVSEQRHFEWTVKCTCGAERTGKTKQEVKHAYLVHVETLRTLNR
ncbi:MAG TPA: hypothetical protein VH539_20405 [Gemmatimonadaceae bacterium]|jgi:hypothetical protein